MTLVRRAAAAVAATLFAYTALTALPAMAAGQVEPPPPGYRPALNTPEGGLWALMDKVEEQMKVSPALVKDEALNAYVKGIVCKLAADQCPTMRLYIVDDPDSNAMTAPNGMIIVWTGLLLRAQNEAELAFVLGHEITHYLKRHSVLNFEHATNAAGRVAFLSTATLGLAALPAALIAIGGIASYSRDQEREADEGGFNLVVANGYDPRQGAAFMANTGEEQDANPNRTKPSAFLSSHPATKERLATLTKRASEIEEQKRTTVVATDEYRKVIGPHRAAWLEEDFNRGDYLQSVAMIKQLVKIEPDSAELQYFLGEAYRRRNGKGDVESATAAYQAAIASMGAPNAAYRGLGLTALKAGQKEAARDAFQKYLSLEPDAKDRAIVEYYLMSVGGAP